MSSSRRKWWIASLLSVAAPGLGQVYNGQGKKGFFFYTILLVISLLLFILLTISVIVELPISRFIVVSVLILVPFLVPFVVISMFVYIIVDAVIIARKQKDDYQLKDYNKWYLYLVAIVISGFMIVPGLQTLVRNFLCQAYMIPSSAMIPTLVARDHILVDKLTCRFKSPNRGDIIVFKYPEDEKRDFVTCIPHFSNRVGRDMILGIPIR